MKRLLLVLLITLSSSSVATSFATSLSSGNLFRDNSRTAPNTIRPRNPQVNDDNINNNKNPLIQIRGGGFPTALDFAPAAAATFATLETFWQTSPYAAGALVCAVKASAADLFAQKTTAASQAEQKKKKADLKRNVAFILYGIFYQGMGCEYIYNNLYPLWFGRSTEPRVVLMKVMCNLLFQATLITLPSAYLIKGIVFRYSPKEALRRYVYDVKNRGLIKKYYALWFPVDCIIFSIIPEHFRVTTMAMVSFMWMIILSTISSKEH